MDANQKGWPKTVDEAVDQILESMSDRVRKLRSSPPYQVRLY